MLERFNHPIVFLLFVTMGVIAFQKIMKWGFTELGWNGPASLVS